MRCGFEKRATASELGAAVHAEWSINGCRHAVNQFVTQNRNRFTTHALAARSAAGIQKKVKHRRVVAC